MKKFAFGFFAVLAALAAPARAQVTVSDSVQFKIKNVNSGLALGIPGASQSAGTGAIQWTDNGAGDQLWHFIPMGSGRYNIENLATHQVLGVANGSKTNGAQVLQWADSGSADHLWTLSQAASGNYLIKNVNSGLYLEVYQGSKVAGASVDQWGATGCLCQEWQLVSTGTAAYAMPGVVGGATRVHDPFMLRDAGGTYWLYGTNNTLASSTDRSTFTNAGSALNPIPAWTATYTKGGTLWAPQVVYMNNKYYQYYSASTNGSQTSAIGLATATTPNSTTWADQGIVISSTPSQPYNAIDPSVLKDQSGNWWMSFGSWWNGLYMMQLDPATGKQSTTNTALYQLAKRGNGLEGSFLYYYNGYYYLFASVNVCCSGVGSTYHTIVGRSSAITGPYVDRGGVNMVNGGGTILVSAHANVNGPGGESLLTDTDGPVMVYHYYDGNNNGAETLGINKVGFTADGWPYLY
ncbi:family 43 glycosylhydrolase [Pseudoduganella sp. LjRoot289]|uniref:family 43 glycosylhydrolase n=1 Tax=Pseudoduganella sp. LjRoot289 TaxID=3342314 RepID=UPI003ECE006F